MNVPSTCFPTQRFPSCPAGTGGRKTLFPLRAFTFRKRKSRTALPPPPLCDTLRKSRISGKSISILITTAPEGKRLRRCKSSCQSGTRSLTSRRRKARTITITSAYSLESTNPKKGAMSVECTNLSDQYEA